MNPRALSGFSISFSIVKPGPNIFLSLSSSSGVMVSSTFLLLSFSSSTFISCSCYLAVSYSSFFSNILLNFLLGSRVIITGAFSTHFSGIGFSSSEQLLTSSKDMQSVLLSFSDPEQLATFSPSITSLEASSLGFYLFLLLEGFALYGFCFFTGLDSGSSSSSDTLFF